MVPRSGCLTPRSTRTARRRRWASTTLRYTAKCSATATMRSRSWWPRGWLSNRTGSGHLVAGLRPDVRTADQAGFAIHQLRFRYGVEFERVDVLPPADAPLPFDETATV